MKEKIRIIILDNDKCYREKLARFLEKESRYQVMGIFPINWATTGTVSHFLPHIILMSVQGDQDKEVKELISALSHHEQINFIALASEACQNSVAKLLLCGINGVFQKTDREHELANIIETVYAGGISISPDLARSIFDYLRNPVVEEMSAKLTRQEFKVLQEVRKGLSYKELAANFHIAESTVRTHCKSIYKKLGVRGRIEAINEVFLNPWMVRVS